MGDFQEIIVYITVAAAVYFLVRKYIFPKKDKGCGPDCNCS